jgi:3-oxoacyl-[acyl-carrier protein] reductase
MNYGLQGTTVLITGAAGGIGQELVRTFSKTDAKIAIHFNKNKKEAEALLKSVPANCQAELFQADLRDENQVAELWKACESKLGAVNTLIANAGIYYPEDRPIQSMSLEQWNNTLSSNLTSIFLCFREFFRGIEKYKLKSPSAVIIGSTAGIHGEAYHADYAASKAALSYGFLASLKTEIVRIAPHGRMNAVCPAWTLTQATEDVLMDTDTVIRTLQTVPLRKFARPQDVANLCLFLSSPELAGHITGQSIPVDGGMEGRVLFNSDEINPRQA